MSESPPFLEPCPPPSRFVRYAAAFGILTPLIAISCCIFSFEYLKAHGHTKFTAFYAVGMFVLLVMVLGFVSGLISLAVAKQHERKGIFRRALIGICLNGFLLVSLIFGPVFYLSVTGHEFPTTPQGRLDEATKALSAASTDENRFYALDDVAKESFNAGKFEDADKYAKELLKLAPNYQGDWNYGNAIQDGNLVLGRIAVRRGQIEEAKSYLLEAGKSPGSPTMDSFGPNMSLAKDLLEKGGQDAVLQYFELCRKFWANDYGKLNQWRDEVKAGNVPSFGANLIY
jgi:uncharacterized membrane protein YeaQ/YmgE (transglycosylase-associated protein family)